MNINLSARSEHALGIRDEDKKTLYFGYSKEQLTIIVLFALINIFSSLIYSLQAPFYPKEAEAKGASATEYGLVLGVFPLVMCVMSPICGLIIGYVSLRRFLNVGMFITAVSCILFGFLDYVDDHVTFIGLSVVLRILQALGDTAFTTAVFTIIAVKFPESVATTFAILETYWGLGLLAGPGLGGGLYELGGFFLPFLFMGICFVVLGIITCWILPDVSHVKNLNEEKTSIFAMLKIPEVLLAFFSLVIAGSSTGFLLSTLEPHLRENFGLTPGITGLVFMIDGGMYAAFAPMWGKLCDNSKQPIIFTIIGATLTFIGFLIIGPAPFIPLDAILWVICIGLVIHALGTAASHVSGFIQAMQGSVNNGLPDNVPTYGLVSGLFLSFITFGVFVGSLIGGVLLDNFGFRMGSIFVLASQILVVFLAGLLMCALKKSRSKTGPSAARGSESSETENLLQKEHVLSKSTDSNISNEEKKSHPKQRTSSTQKLSDYGAL